MTDKVDKIENFEPLQPLDIKFKKPEKLQVCGCNPENPVNPVVKEVEEALKLAEGCGCGSSNLYSAVAPLMVFEESCAMPVSVERVIVKEDEIKTAQDVINQVFALFKPANTDPNCSKDSAIAKTLELDLPKEELAKAPEIQDAVIAKIVEKVLAKMQGRVAIIKQKDSKLTCLNANDKIEYLVVEGKEGSEGSNGNSEAPKPTPSPEDPKPTPNPANPATPDISGLPADARDGIIEDLVGVIEVAPGVTGVNVPSTNTGL